MGRVSAGPRTFERSVSPVWLGMKIWRTALKPIGMKPPPKRWPQTVWRTCHVSGPARYQAA
eukprot:1173737-Alexandrium_andersonii.AAC.1